MDGLRDDFAIWDRALTDGEIQGLFEAGLEGISVGQLLVPEPSTAMLLLLSGIGLAGIGRPRRTMSSPK